MPRMELRQLRAFVAVATMRHFGRAAKRLHLTQPALTQRIQALEHELGMQLLERSSREVRLTRAGTVLLPHAQVLVQEEDEALKDLQDYSSGVTGRVRIAYHAAGDVSLAGSIIAAYRHRYPQVELETSAASSAANLQRLLDYTTDAAFALMPRARPDVLDARPIRREEIIVAIGSDHRLARMDRIPVEQLRGEPLAMPPVTVNPGLVAALSQWLVRRTGADLNVVSDDPSDLALQTVARPGMAAALVVRRTVAGQPPPGLAIRSLHPAPLAELVIAYRRDDTSPTLANLLRVVDEVAPFDPGGVPEDGELI
jgi:DNA-binding transcriptional LysR family regulator